MSLSELRQTVYLPYYKKISANVFQHLHLYSTKYGIEYSNLQETLDSFFNSFFSITSSIHNFDEYIEKLNVTNLPIMIAGELGCGKEQVARAIYSKSRFSNNPFILINCELINDKSWNYLTNHYNSPFNDNDNTIYFENITKLPDNKMKQLLSIIIDTNLVKRNRLIISCVNEMGKGISESAMAFVNQLSCVLINLVPLRERAEYISSFSSVFFSSINAEGNNQVLGFDDDALELMKSYSWPNNYTQFKRILGELVMITSEPFICYDDVKNILDNENRNMSPNLPIGNSFGDMTLDEINAHIIQNALKECNHNQSLVAKKLGISRTTLWRYLKVIES